MDPMQSRSAGYLVRLSAAVFLIQILVLLLRSWLALRLADGGMSAAVAKDLSYLIVPPLLALLLAPLAGETMRALRGKLLRRQLTVRVVVAALLLGISLRLAHRGALIAGVGFGFVRNPDPAALAGPLIAFDCPPLQIAALNLFVMALLTPVVEETINRGWFLSWFLRYGRLVAITVSSLLFAAVHRPDAIPAAFAGGIFLGVFYLNSGSLWGPLIAHATVNALVLADWHCLRAIWNPPEISDASLAVGALATALTACSLALAALLVSKRVVGPRPDDPPASF